MSISSSWDLASDAELITAVRTGDSAAFGVLYERHSSAARAVAHQYSNSAADAEDAAADAFQRVFATIQSGGGPDVAFRAYLFTVVRRVAMDRVHIGRRVQTTDDLEAFEEDFGAAESSEDPTFAGFERSVVSRAYKSLPERWQVVLWYTEVEGLNPAQIAPVLGLTANGVAALAYRAREGLRQAYLQQHLAAPMSEACTIVNGKLGAYVRGGLARRETALVEMHLEECGDCRALVLELGDVNHGLRAIIAPLVLGAIGVGVLQGIGFGGAAGAAGAAAAAAGAGAGGAAVGSGGGVGVGAGAGTAGAAAGGTGAAAGAGSLVGAGAGLSAAASGVAAVGGAAALAASFGAIQPAAASTSFASGGVVAGGAAGGSAAAAASTTGLAALIAGLPVTAIGLAAAGVIVAGAVAVAGTLGLFSPDDSSPDITASEPELPAPGPDQSTDTGTDTGDPTTEDPADVVPPADPTNIPPVDDTTDPVIEPATVTPTTEPTTPPTPTPTPTPTTDPPVDPPAPANLVVTPPVVRGGGIVAGQEQLVRVAVDNTGGQSAGPVIAQFAFPAGTQTAVAAVPEPAGGGFASVIPSTAWVCAPTPSSGTSVWDCTLADLPAGSASTLYAGVTITDDDVDGDRPLDFTVQTSAAGVTTPSTMTVSTRVASPPTAITVGAIAGATLEGVAGSFAEATVTVPVTNAGTHAPVAVTIVGIPVGVAVTPGVGWTCDAALVCSYPDLPRGATRDLVLTLADTEALVDVDSAISVKATGPTNFAAFDLAVKSAPAAYGVEFRQLTSRGATIDTEVTLANTGRTRGDVVRVAVDLPDSMTWADSAWEKCSTEEPGDACLTVARVTPAAAPGALPLTLVAPGRTAPGSYSYSVTVRVTDAAGVTASRTANVSVTQTPADLTTSTSVLMPTDLAPNVVAQVTVSATNTGETAADADVTVTLPAGTEADASTGWRLVAGEWQRTVAVAPGATQTVTLGVRNTNPGPSVVDTSVGVRIATGGVVASEQSHGLTLKAPATAPAALAVQAPAETILTKEAAAPVTFGVENTGGQAATGVVAWIKLPGDVFFEVADVGSPWACAPATGSNAEVRCFIRTLAAGERSELTVLVRPQGNAEGKTIEFSAEADGVARVTAQPLTTIRMSTDGSTCAEPWVRGARYAQGDVVWYTDGWNYRAKSDVGFLLRWFPPGKNHYSWDPVARCTP